VGTRSCNSARAAYGLYSYKHGGPGRAKLLGPFLGFVTSHSIKIWLHLESKPQTIYVSLHEGNVKAPQAAAGVLNLRKENLFTDCITIEGLRADTRYFYKLWTDPQHLLSLDRQGLTEKDLQFRTLSDDTNAQIDFLLMSCHNPTVSGADGFDGHAVWADLPQIISRESNKSVLAANPDNRTIRRDLEFLR
jgi:hypothetical protein